MADYDLIVIGSGPAGEKAAVKAAYFGRKVALIEKEKKFGGAGVQTGTLPSKTLKETALYLSGVYQKGVFGVDKEVGRSTISVVPKTQTRKGKGGEAPHRNLLGT